MSNTGKQTPSYRQQGIIVTPDHGQPKFVISSDSGVELVLPSNHCHIGVVFQLTDHFFHDLATKSSCSSDCPLVFTALKAQSKSECLPQIILEQQMWFSWWETLKGSPGHGLPPLAYPHMVLCPATRSWPHWNVLAWSLRKTVVNWRVKSTDGKNGARIIGV